MKVFEGALNAKGVKVALVVGRFNELISKELLAGAIDCLVRHGALEKDLAVSWTPGSMEIPLTAQKMAETGKYDVVVALGAVIRGGTPHFEYVSSQVSRGLMTVSLETKVPVIMGIITADTIEQALERAGTKAGNRGWQAALSAIEEANLLTKIGG